MDAPRIFAWRVGDPVLFGPEIALDTETELIVDHTVPRLVTLQAYAGGDTAQVVRHDDAEAYLVELFKNNPKADIIMHNAAFDYWVLRKALNGAKVFRHILDACEEGRLRDTMIRYTMWHVAVRGFVGKRSLAHACKDMLNVNVAKDAGVRLTFKRDTALDLDHLIYAGEDPVHTWRLHKAISEDYTKAEKYHTQGAIALADISRRGMLVDEGRRAKLEGKYQGLIKGCLDVLEMNGYVPGQKGNKKVLAARLTEMESTYNIKFMRTEKTGQISTTDESLEAIGDVDIPFLNALKNHAHYNKIMGTYLKTDAIGPDGRVHTRFDPYVKTSRTSSSAPNIQNLPRKEGIRGIFIPTPGCVYNACDYSTLELCTLAQHCLVDYGFSKLAETINSGVDCHKSLAAAIYGKTYDEVKKAERAIAKVAGFGYMGGLAAETFIGYAKGCGIKIDLEASTKVRDAWLKAYPEMEQHLKPPRSADGDWYTAKNILGMIRGKCLYTETCNYQPQSLAATGGKRALWLLMLAGAPVVNFVHDEMIYEIPLGSPREMTDKADEYAAIQVAAMREVVPDVLIKTEGALMDRWYRRDGEFNDDGTMKVLTEGVENE